MRLFPAAIVILLPFAAQAQKKTISIEEYEPTSTLVVPQHVVVRAKYPFIDVHNHQRDVSKQKVADLLHDMDALNMRILIDSPVNGGFGDFVRKAHESFQANGQGRFAVMTNIDFTRLDDPDYSARAARQLEQDIRAGAIGLKVWQNFGMSEKDKNGRVHMDDPRFDAVFEICAKNNLPVLIHTGVPKTFWMPIDKTNERALELITHPGRHIAADQVGYDELMAERERLFAKHPKTKFIMAHMGWMGNDLGALGKMFDRLPNVYVDVAAVASEIGRQPRFARQFFINYQDRALYGKDAYVIPEYYAYFRLFETADEYFDPTRRYHGMWQLYGLDLPDEVLKKIYYKNALRLFPTLPKDGFPQ